MELAFEYAQRISDVHRLGPQFLTEEGTLRFIQTKNSDRAPVEVELPVPDYLQEIITATPNGDRTYVVTEYGNPFSAGGLGNKFREWRDEAGLPPYCAMHGLRKAGSVYLAESENTPHQIKADTGHQSDAEVRRYTEKVRKKKLAQQVFEKRAREREKVPLFDVDTKSGTIEDANPLETNTMIGEVAARRGLQATGKTRMK